MGSGLYSPTLVVFGAIVADILIAYMISAGRYEADNSDPRNSDTGEPSNDKNDPRPLISNGEIENPKTLTKQKDSNDKPNDDRHPRLERGYWISQMVLAVIGVGGIIIALCTLSDLNQNVADTHKQAVAAATQATTAQQEFELSERPWVSADPIQFSDLTFDKNAGHFTIRFLLKNTGHSPAAHTHIEAQLIPIKFDQIFKEPLKRQKQVCDSARNRNTAIEFAAFTLFPGDQTTRDAGMSMGQADIKSAEFRPPNTKERPFIVPIIVGCVDYQFEFKPGHHQTGFIYMLYRFEGKNRGGARIYPGQNLPVSKLIFEPFAFGGSYAD